jgi:ubiquinone/menaquinone biosynthesis C-methylase UbiE
MMDINKQADIARCYDKFSGWGEKPDDANLERIEKTRALVPNEVRTILDLGCGDGIVTNEFVKRGLDVTGVDFSVAALRFVAGKRLIASVDNLPFPEEHFDLVICAETLEHLPDEIYENTLGEIERVAKQYVVISTPNNEYLPSASIKCENCRKVFHRNLHVRSFDKNIHRRLFQKFTLKRTVGIQKWRQMPLFIDFQQNLLGVYAPARGAICPNCNHKNSRKPGIWERIVLEASRRIAAMVLNTASDRWIISLFQRQV